MTLGWQLYYYLSENLQKKRHPPNISVLLLMLHVHLKKTKQNLPQILMENVPRGGGGSFLLALTESVLYC